MFFFSNTIGKQITKTATLGFLIKAIFFFFWFRKDHYKDLKLLLLIYISIF